ncbi:MAG: hypothetical protein RQ753_06510 [Desulfurivibrionaceae bacterium]|nr:hypothetical protein [Desulfobulbales bacterium]MDT8335330.1 hypothetical protein [Desulfurivibrionaceae bacterium]
MEQQPRNSPRRLAEHTKTARISCPICGNDKEFLEVADGVILTSHYIQNKDGSFTQDGDESEILGDITLFCGDCGADLTEYHQHFLDMLF